ncbi:MAG TPA: hypothetical protein IAB83_08765 [Candidatus Faecousia faecavium]|nr:hypothetical protein [Candidatus Faecousia faecavium]
MEYWQYLSGFAAVIVFLLAIRSAVVKKRKRKERDFTRKLETVLQPRETIKVICPNHGSRWILTSRRLLLDTKDGFLAYPFGKIKKLQGFDSTGKATTSVAKMKRLTIKIAKTDEEYTLDNSCEEFSQLAGQLKRQTAKKKKP